MLQLPNRVPALVVTGTRDANVPPDMVKAYCDVTATVRGCATTELLEIEGADHFDIVQVRNALPLGDGE